MATATTTPGLCCFSGQGVVNVGNPGYTRPMTTTAPDSIALPLFDLDPIPGDDARYLGTCGGCTKTYSRPRASKLVRCCGGFVPMAKVSGTYSATHRCNSECMFARGPRCVCGCSGRNHGRGWLAGLDITEEGE